MCRFAAPGRHPSASLGAAARTSSLVDPYGRDEIHYRCNLSNFLKAPATRFRNQVVKVRKNAATVRKGHDWIKDEMRSQTAAGCSSGAK